MNKKDNKSVESKIEEAFIFHNIESPTEFALKGLGIESSESQRLIEEMTKHQNLKLESINIILFLRIKSPEIQTIALEDTSYTHFATEINQLLNNKSPNDDDIQTFVDCYSNIIEALYLIDFKKEFYTGVYKRINDTIDKLHNELPYRYKFIKSFNKIELGNILKINHNFFNTLNLEKNINDEIANIKLLIEYLKNPKGLLSAPAIKEIIEQLKKEHLNEYSIDFFDFSEVEFLEFKRNGLETFGAIKAEILLMLKACFRFNSVNKKGLSSFLYELFSVIMPDNLPTHSAWLEDKKDSPSADDANAWAKFKLRAVEKITQIDLIFN